MQQLFGWWRRCRKGDGVGDGIFAVDQGGGGGGGGGGCWPGWRLRCGLEPSPVWVGCVVSVCGAFERRCVCVCCVCVRAACVRAHARVFAARVCVSSSYVCACSAVCLSARVSVRFCVFVCVRAVCLFVCVSVCVCLLVCVPCFCGGGGGEITQLFCLNMRLYRSGCEHMRMHERSVMCCLLIYDCNRMFITVQ